MRVSRGSLLLLLLGTMALGCRTQAGSIPAASVTPPVGDPPLADDLFLRVTGQGSTEDEAYAAAERALAEALLEDPSWATLVGLTVHRRGVDPQSTRPKGEGVEVELGLSRPDAAGVLSAFENGEPPVDAPPAWRDAIVTARRAHLAAHACRRRAALFESECEPADTSEADGALAQLSSGLVLDPVHRYGVPVDGEGRPLREPGVYVFWGGVPMAEVPVVAEPVQADPAGEPGEPLRGSADLTGRAMLPIDPTVPFTPLRVHLDGEALLGPLRDLAPSAETTLEPVAVGWKRWGMVIGRGDEGLQRSDETMAGLAAGMREAGLGKPMQMTPPQMMPLLEARGDERIAAVKALGDEYAGRLDVVLVLTYESRFASRMGGNRVWYEAEGRLEALSVWTGEVLAQATDKVEVDGIGDERAEKAARRALAEALVKTVLAARRR